MTLDRKLLSIQTIKDNIAILESIEPDDAGYYLQLEHEKFVLSALEKQIPKKPKKINEYLTDNGKWEIDWECATCGNPYIDDSYCNCCGQALDWSDSE